MQVPILSANFWLLLSDRVPLKIQMKLRTQRYSLEEAPGIILISDEKHQRRIVRFLVSYATNDQVPGGANTAGLLFLQFQSHEMRLHKSSGNPHLPQVIKEPVLKSRQKPPEISGALEAFLKVHVALDSSVLLPLLFPSPPLVWRRGQHVLRSRGANNVLLVSYGIDLLYTVSHV